MHRLAFLVLLAGSAAPALAQDHAHHAAAPAAAAASFGGEWRLDTSLSRDLPPFYAAVREHRLTITHTDSSLVVDVVMVDTAGTATPLSFPYDLRRPVKTTTQVLTPRGPLSIPTTLTAKPRADGGMEIDIAREITMGERVIRPGDHESWTLSADGRQLLIDRVAEMPGPGGMRTFRTHHVFVRS
jgi:hypothetical protein